jgi:hypothetical protein
MQIAVGTAHVTVVNIPEKGELWSTYEKANVPSTADMQQVPRSNLELNRMESLYGARSKSCKDMIETVGVTGNINV